MRMNVLVNSSSSHGDANKIDTSLYVQKPYLGTNFLESNIEEDIDVKSQFRIQNLSCLIENTDAVCKSYVHSGFNNSSLFRKTTRVDFDDKKLDKVQFCRSK